MRMMRDYRCRTEAQDFPLLAQQYFQRKHRLKTVALTESLDKAARETRDGCQSALLPSQARTSLAASPAASRAPQAPQSSLPCGVGASLKQQWGWDE